MMWTYGGGHTLPNLLNIQITQLWLVNNKIVGWMGGWIEKAQWSNYNETRRSLKLFLSLAHLLIWCFKQKAACEFGVSIPKNLQ